MSGQDIKLGLQGSKQPASDLPVCGVCSLDTGRLHPETYQLFDKVEKHYGIHIEYTFPDAQETQDLVRAKGMFSFYVDGHQECCRIRKVCNLLEAVQVLITFPMLISTS